MGDLLHRAISESSLLAAWQEVQANDLEDGKVSDQVAEYARGVLARLTDLGRELKAGTWRPAPVYAREIGKRSGGTRLLAVPAVEDRIVERAVMEVIDEYVDAVLLPWSYAHRKGLGVKDALHDLAAARDEGARWVVRTRTAEVAAWTATLCASFSTPTRNACSPSPTTPTRAAAPPTAPR